MNIVLPIVLMSAILGLFAPIRYTRFIRWFMGAWIMLVIAVYYIKN